MVTEQIEAEEITLSEFIELNPRLLVAAMERKARNLAERSGINIRLTECQDGVFRPLISRTDYRKEKTCCGGSGPNFNFRPGGFTTTSSEQSKETEWVKSAFFNGMKFGKMFEDIP